MADSVPPKKTVSSEDRLLAVSEGLASAAKQLTDLVASLQTSFQIDPNRDYHHPPEDD